MDTERRRHAAGRGMGCSAALLAAALGCGEAGDAASSSSAPCPNERAIAGICAGVPDAPLCGADVCTDGVLCTTTTEAGDDAELAAALTGASSGACVALRPGSYGAVQVPGGVSLLGKGAGEVLLAGVAVLAGGGSVLRGLGVGAQGVALIGATDVRIEAVHVSGPAADGILLVSGASATVATTTVEAAGLYGIRVAEGGTLKVDASFVTACEAGGIAAVCPDGCACAARPSLTLERTVAYANRVAGLAFYASTVNVSKARVAATLGGKAIHAGQFGGGMLASDCAGVDAAELVASANTEFGVLAHRSTVLLAGGAVHGNVVGIWAQEIGVPPAEGPPPGEQTVHVEEVDVHDNAGVGVGFGGGSKGIIICKTQITGTTMKLVPVEAGKGEVGDGVLWSDASQALIEQVALSGNARASILIDGPVGGGSIGAVTLAGGDEQKGIVQQNLDPGGKEVAIGAGAPPLQKVVGLQFSVAAPPAAPEQVGN